MYNFDMSFDFKRFKKGYYEASLINAASILLFGNFDYDDTITEESLVSAVKLIRAVVKGIQHSTASVTSSKVSLESK